MARGDAADRASRLKWERIFAARRLIDRDPGYARLSNRTVPRRGKAALVHFATAERLAHMMPATYRIESTLTGRVIRNVKQLRRKAIVL